METTYKTPTEEDKEKALKLLESLEEWRIAKQKDRFDIHSIVEFINKYPTKMFIVKSFLEFINSEKGIKRNQKFAEFILSLEDKGSVDHIKYIFGQFGLFWINLNTLVNEDHYSVTPNYTIYDQILGNNFLQTLAWHVSEIRGKTSYIDTEQFEELGRKLKDYLNNKISETTLIEEIKDYVHY